MFKIAAALAAVAYSLSAGALPTQPVLDNDLRELSSLTGFPIRHGVKFEILTRAQVNGFLHDRMAQTVKPAELRAEELTLKKFGFVPQDFDLKQTTLDLLTEQTAAFYDFHRKKLYITDWANTSLQDIAIVHELAHALADQNYSLEKFSKKVEQDSEQALAREAVVEGQATWLMRSVASQHPGQKDQKAEGDAFPLFDKAPLYLRETLMFPYNDGASFQQAIIDKFGKDAFARVFRTPPISTQQVLHPELYIAGLVPVTVSLPTVKGLKDVVEGVLGELDHSILLRQYIGESEAREVSPKWRGGRFRLSEDKKTKRTVLVYRSAWTDAATARRYFELYERVLAKKWKQIAVSSRGTNRIAGSGDDGYFTVTLDKNEVTSREGFEQPLSSAPEEPEF